MVSVKSIARLAASLVFLIVIDASAFGFTFVTSPPGKLPATLENPNISFLWDGKAPPFQGKETFREGAFANDSDEQIMGALISEAMASWNNVRGSYLRLKSTTSNVDVVPDTEDRVNVIVMSPSKNLNTAAAAAPTISRMGAESEISDCDIVVDTKRVTIRFMIYALTHELGHCLGLGHAHDNYHSVMGYSRTPGPAELGADDKAGIIYLYGDPAYGDPKVRELIGVHCGVVGEVGHAMQMPRWRGPWLLLVLPLLMLLCRREFWCVPHRHLLAWIQGRSESGPRIDRD